MANFELSNTQYFIILIFEYLKIISLMSCLQLLLPLLLLPYLFK